MGLEDSLNRAFGLSDAILQVARVKSAESLVASPMLGSGFGNSPGFMLERLRHLQGWQYAVIRVIAQRIAGQALCLGRKASGGTKGGKLVNKSRAPAWVKRVSEQIELIDQHPLLDAIARPNPYMAQWAFMFVTIASLQSAGEAYWWLTRDGGQLQFWFLPPHWVYPQHTEERLFDHYKIVVQGTGEQQDVDASEIVRIHFPDPLEPYVSALSPLSTQAKAIVADEMIQTAQYRAFENGIFPKHAVIIGRHPDVEGTPGQRPILTKEQRATLMAALKQAYRGVQQAGEPVILDGLVEDIKDLSNGPAEMGFLESSQLTKERITQGFGVNPVVMGQLEGANRASASVADENFVANAVNPLIEMLSQTLTTDLAPRIGEPDLLIWIEPARTRDVDAERSDRDQLIKAGAITRNELRAAYDLPPLEGPEGDELIQPSGGLQLAMVDGGHGQPTGSFRILNQAG